nr:putative gag-polypeptide of LTR copia-type [Ipomoea batatas]
MESSTSQSSDNASSAKMQDEIENLKAFMVFMQLRFDVLESERAAAMSEDGSSTHTTDINNDDLATQITNLIKNGLNSQNQNPKQNLSDSLTISLKLNSQNYALWARMIRVAIGGKSKTLLSHLSGNPAPPNPEDDKYEQWEQDDLVVFSWLIQNIEPALASNLTEFPTAKSLWDALVVTYSSGKDKLKTFDLHVKANEIKQNAEGAYAVVRKETAHQNILGAVSGTASSQQGVAAGLAVTGPSEAEGLGLISKGRRRSDQTGKTNGSSSRPDKSQLKCSHCDMSKHTKEQCFKIVGYPEWWNDGHKQSGKTAKLDGGRAAAAVGNNNAIISSGDVQRNTREEGGFGGMAATKWDDETEEINHSTKDESLNTPTQSMEPIVSATENALPNLMPEVSNTYPSNTQSSNTENAESAHPNLMPEVSNTYFSGSRFIVTDHGEKTIEQVEPVQEEMVELCEPPQEETPERYVLPPRANRGIPPKRDRKCDPPHVRHATTMESSTSQSSDNASSAKMQDEIENLKAFMVFMQLRFDVLESERAGTSSSLSSQPKST